MWTVLIAIAWGLEMPTTEQTLLRNHTLGPEQPLLVTSTWGTPEHLAKRLRLRAPDGRLVAVRRETLGDHVRLVPRRPLEVGTYTVEERGDYDGSGHRLYETRPEAHHAGWFPSFEIEVVDDQVERAAPQVDWSYGAQSMPRGPNLGLLAAAVQVDRADWVELEVDGVGVVDLATWAYEGAFRLSTLRSRGCVVSHRDYVLDGGDLTVRAVAHGPGGWTATSPWTTVSAASWRRGVTNPLPPAAPPTGHEADPDDLPTWRRVRGSVSSAAPTPSPSSCGRLRSADSELLDGHAVADDEGGVRLFTPDGDGWLLDGEPIDVDGSDVWALASHDGVDFVIDGFRTKQPRLSRYESGRLVARIELDLGRYDLGADGSGVHLHWVTKEGTWKQELDLALVPLGEPEPTTEEPAWWSTELAYGERTVWREARRLFVEDAEGFTSSIVADPSDAVGVDGEHVVIARRRSVDDQHRLQVERFACSGEALGVPERWGGVR